MNKKIVIASNYDDWEGCYIDGKIVEQGHQIRLDVILKALGFDVDFKEIDYEWLLGQGHLPLGIKDAVFCE